MISIFSEEISTTVIISSILFLAVSTAIFVLFVNKKS
jgi:hypothetical protein